MAFSLADLGLVGVSKEGHVVELGHLPAKSPVEENVDGGGNQPLLGPDHVRHPHEVVVHHVGQVVGGVPIGLEEDHIGDLLVVVDHHPPELVPHLGGAGPRHLQADHVGLAPFCPFLGFLGRDVAGAAVVPSLFLPDPFQLLRGLEGPVGPPPPEEFLGVLLVEG